ncbi:hypothetical protein PsorP6_000195 [Peronosclerospora sorghi]|uniref:Uncharacterized protein n=1 Tax=Peronosclerospora sorghi TaxID=230839 RepID=A0ACC0WW23_9STRA|nr:hypothetical protein PsorP6_000195 [Peronosclerospora sorghi]
MSDGTKLISVIGDEDTVTGFILAGIGHRTAEGTNFLVVKPATPISVIEANFRLLTNREDIAILLINQHVAEEIRHLLNTYDKTIPTILEIPSKDMPYDPAKDYIMKRPVQTLIETITCRRATSLNKPVTVAQAMQTQLIRHLCSTHRVRQILLVRKYQQHRVPQLIFIQHTVKLITGCIHTVAII